MALKRVLILFIGILLLAITLKSALATEINGTIRDVNGLPLNNSLINVTVRSVQGFSVLGYNSSTTNASGWFNLTVDGTDPTRMFQPVLTHTNTTYSAGFVDYVGKSLPTFPAMMYDQMGSTNFFLQPAGTINLTAINSSGQYINFSYQVKDTKLGYPVAEQMNSNTYSAVVYVPSDRNYSIMIYPFQSMPVSFDWSNFSVTSSYNLTINKLSHYNATTKTLHKTFNTTMGFARVSGYLNYSNIGGWDQFRIVPFLLEGNNMLHVDYGPMPYNMSSMVHNGVSINTSDWYTLTSGFYNITLPATVESSSTILFASGRNDTQFIGGFRNISFAYSAANTEVSQFNFSWSEGLSGGVFTNITLNLLTGGANPFYNVSTIKQRFNLVNKTNSTLSNVFAHAEITVDYSQKGAIEFTWMNDIQQGSAPVLSIPHLNTTSIKEMNVFASGGDYAPKRASYTAAELKTNNNANANATNITLNNFNPEAIGTAIASSQITMAMYISNSTCDVPNPPAACTIGSSSSMADFSPISAIIGGGKISFRMGTGNIKVHYVNVDLIASGPPDAMFDSAANTSSTTSTSFDSAVRFGSSGPTVYDYVLVSIPYSETAGSGLDDARDVNMSLPYLYDDSWNILWNTTSNGTNPAALAANYSHYNTYSSQWASLMNQTNCTVNATAMTSTNTINSTSPCFIDRANNNVWIRLPHFSGTGPKLTGATTASAATPPASGGSGSAYTPAGPGTPQEAAPPAEDNKVTKESPADYDISQSSSPETTIKASEGTTKSFTIDGKVKHTISFKSITEGKATIVIKSDPIEVTLSIGESKDLNIDEDSLNDLTVTLLSIKDGQAEVTIKNLDPIKTTLTTTLSNPEVSVSPGKSRAWAWALGVVGLAIIIILAIKLIDKLRRGKHNYTFTPKHH